MPSDAQSVADSIYTQIRVAILRGEYPPGARLTSVHLAERFDVSRTPVRSALTRLKSDGLVDLRGGQAAWVLPLTVEAVEEAYEIAEALESLLVRRSAADDEYDASVLLRFVEQMESAARDADRQRWAEADHGFHQHLRSAVGNELLNTMLDRVDTVIERVRFLSLNLRPEGATISAAEHRAVAEAIAAGDVSEARRRHEEHLVRVREENVQFLRDSFSLVGTVPTPGLRT